MINMEKMRKQLTLAEGLRRFPYKCTAGHWTIGVGHNLDAHGWNIFGMTEAEIRAKGLTEDQCMTLLDGDIQSMVKQVNTQLPWVQGLDEVRQRVLVDMAFNMGIATLKKFVNTLKAVQEGRFDDAASGMLKSLWAKQVHGRANKLAKMMRSGKDV